MEEDFLSCVCVSFLLAQAGRQAGGGSFGQVSDVRKHLSFMSYISERDISIDGNNLLVKTEKLK